MIASYLGPRTRGASMSSFWNQAAVAAGQHQARCDVIQADYRAQQEARASIRRDPPPLPKSLIPTEDELMLRLAEEIEYARRMLDAMGDELSSDGVIVSRHLAELQALDIAGQMLGHIACVLRSSDIPGAVDGIGMADLKARLMRRPKL
jgi:hypothetical protein